MINTHSTSGFAEDMIRALMHLCALEMHFKTHIEKLNSELEEGMYSELGAHIEAINQARIDCQKITDIRRKDMMRLYETFGSIGDKQYWCVVKHLLTVAITTFEVWQATDDNEDYEGFMDVNKLLVFYLTKFLGVEVTSCASCFSDMLKTGVVGRG